MTMVQTETKTETLAETEVGTGALWGLTAEFSTPGEVMDAAKKVRKAGYRWWDCCTPFPVHGLDGAMGIRPTILPILVFFAGVTGTTVAFILQTFTNSTDWNIWALVWVTGYPYLISGKPILPLNAFIPVMFELTILFAALTAVFGMYIMNGLPRLNYPLFNNPNFGKVTDDKFFIVIESRDPKFFHERTVEFLESLGPDRIEEVRE
jgi:hypothetical protein